MKKLDLRYNMHAYIIHTYTGAAELTQSCGAQLTNKTHFYCEKLNSYEHL